MSNLQIGINIIYQQLYKLLNNCWRRRSWKFESKRYPYRVHC